MYRLEHTDHKEGRQVKFDAVAEIGASRGEVWKVLVDIERWPTWTKSIRELTWMDDGGMRIGNRARVKQPNLPTLVWGVTELEPGVSFSWRSSKAGVSTVGSHVLEDVGGDRTYLTLGIDQSGPLARLVATLTGKRTTQYLRMECEGLKLRCEPLKTSDQGPLHD
jgi:uncharacterized membrane protein